jgi:hypothetical protein
LAGEVVWEEGEGGVDGERGVEAAVGFFDLEQGLDLLAEGDHLATHWRFLMMMR